MTTADTLKGLSRAIGGPTEITLAGRSFRVDSITLADYAEMENAIRESRSKRNLLAEASQAVANLDRDLAESILLRALEQQREMNEVSLADIQRFITTPSGGIVALVAVLHRSNPTIDRDEIRAVVASATQSEITAAINKAKEASGDGPLDSSTSPAPTKLPKAARRSRGQSRSAK